MNPDTDKPKPPVPLYIWAAIIYTAIFACALIVFIVWGLRTGPRDMMYILALSSKSNLKLLIIFWGLMFTAGGNLTFTAMLYHSHTGKIPQSKRALALRAFILLLVNITFPGILYWAYCGAR